MIDANGEWGKGVWAGRSERPGIPEGSGDRNGEETSTQPKDRVRGEGRRMPADRGLIPRRSPPGSLSGTQEGRGKGRVRGGGRGRDAGDPGPLEVYREAEIRCLRAGTSI